MEKSRIAAKQPEVSDVGTGNVLLVSMWKIEGQFCDGSHQTRNERPRKEERRVQPEIAFLARRTEEEDEPDDLLCSRNARPRKALVGRAQGRSISAHP